MPILRGALDAAKRRAPGTYWRVRTAASLAAWYAQRARDRIRPASATPFDEDFWRRNETGDWDGFARAILRRFPAASALDVGCGDGKLLAAMRRASPTLRAMGVDQSPAALERARARGISTRALDLAGTSVRGTDALARELGSFDLAISLETVEHVPAWHSAKLLRLLAACAPAIVFSGAQPLQGGVLHVNERPPEHWIARFRNLGYDLAPENDALRADVAALDLPPWYAANLNAFVRRGG
ncbi:MAG TPA: methyltransferase [Longimicrobium sp.]